MAIPLAYNIRNLRVRKATTVMTALGIALTVAVLLGIMALVGGLRAALSVTGNPLHVMLTRQGSTSELTSVLTDEKFQIVKFLPGIAKIDGEPAASHELVTVISLPLRDNPAEEGNINIRGISEIGMKMRADLKLVEGRWLETGKREAVVGEALQGIRAHTSVGDKLEFGRGQWEVVGIFDAGKSAYNSEIWADGNFVTADYGRQTARSSILVRATDAAAAQALINRVGDDQRLVLDGELERDYYAKQMTAAAPVQSLGLFVAAIMAIGSSFAAMNTMYAAVARRAREIGVLRVLGFSRGSILVSFLIESLSLSLLGGLLGCVLALPLNGIQTRIGNFVTFSETAFEFQVTPDSIVAAVVFAAVMGVLGGILPARMAARRDILASLREL